MSHFNIINYNKKPKEPLIFGLTTIGDSKLLFPLPLKGKKQTLLFIKKKKKSVAKMKLDFNVFELQFVSLGGS